MFEHFINILWTLLYILPEYQVPYEVRSGKPLPPFYSNRQLQFDYLGQMYVTFLKHIYLPAYMVVHSNSSKLIATYIFMGWCNDLITLWRTVP